MHRLTAIAALVVGLAAAAAFGAAAAPVAAHVPFLEPARPSTAPAEPGDPFPGAVQVPDAAVSRAVYGTLARGEQFDAYRLSVTEPARTPVELLVPAAGAYEVFRPALALVGPGIPAAGAPPAFIGDRLRAAYGAQASEVGVRAVRDPATTPRLTFYEPFSFTNYYRGGSTEVELTPGNAYYLVVYDPAGGRGEYALGIAEAERFTPADWFRSVVAIVRIKLGLYGQGAFHPLAAVVLAALAVALAGLVVWGWRRRRRATLRARARAAGP
jgi:hypothetical protein